MLGTSTVRVRWVLSIQDPWYRRLHSHAAQTHAKRALLASVSTYIPYSTSGKKCLMPLRVQVFKKGRWPLDQIACSWWNKQQLTQNERHLTTEAIVEVQRRISLALLVTHHNGTWHDFRHFVDYLKKIRLNQKPWFWERLEIVVYLCYQEYIYFDIILDL